MDEFISRAAKEAQLDILPEDRERTEKSLKDMLEVFRTLEDVDGMPEQRDFARCGCVPAEDAETADASPFMYGCCKDMTDGLIRIPEA